MNINSIKLMAGLVLCAKGVWAAPPSARDPEDQVRREAPNRHGHGEDDHRRGSGHVSTAAKWNTAQRSTEARRHGFENWPLGKRDRCASILHDLGELLECSIRPQSRSLTDAPCRAEGQDRKLHFLATR